MLLKSVWEPMLPLEFHLATMLLMIRICLPKLVRESGRLVFRGTIFSEIMITTAMKS